MGPQMWPLGRKKALSPDSPAWGRLWPSLAGQEPEAAGLGPAWARPGLPKLQKNIQHENEHILIVRTPFLIILDSLELSQWALQDYAEKHHSPTIYYNKKWGKVKPLSCKPEPSYLLQMKFGRGETNFVGKSMIVAILGNIWEQLRAKLSTHVCVDNFSRTNRQYF